MTRTDEARAGEGRTGGDATDGDAADGDTGISYPSGNGPTGVESADPFGWPGWVLVATLAVALLVVPGALLVLPAAQGVVASLGLSLRDAYLVLPLVPAFLLGAVAVWSALRHRER